MVPTFFVVLLAAQWISSAGFAGCSISLSSQLFTISAWVVVCVNAVGDELIMKEESTNKIFEE